MATEWYIHTCEGSSLSIWIMTPLANCLWLQRPRLYASMAHPGLLPRHRRHFLATILTGLNSGHSPTILSTHLGFVWGLGFEACLMHQLTLATPLSSLSGPLVHPRHVDLISAPLRLWA